MAVLAFVNAPGLTREKYDAIVPLANWKNDTPAGLVMHCCSFDEQGNAHVADIWASAQHMMDFFATRLEPAFAQVGFTMTGHPEIYEMYNLDFFGQNMHAI